MLKLSLCVAMINNLLLCCKNISADHSTIDIMHTLWFSEGICTLKLYEKLQHTKWAALKLQ